MKLWNKTTIPSEILEPVIKIAGKLAGARTLNVIVIATQARSMGVSGEAWQSNEIEIPSWVKRARSYRSGRGVKYSYSNNDYNYYITRFAKTDGGYFYLRIPYRKNLCANPSSHWDFINSAQSVYRVAIHEWAHIKDFQDKTCKRTQRTPSGRRVKWEERHCERYANSIRREALKKPNQISDDEILNLAIVLEEKCK